MYRGRLRTTGEEVAVKVQRPGIGDSIALDMVLLRRLMAVIDNNIPQASFSRGLRWQSLRLGELDWGGASPWTWSCCSG